jgi:hypothetical protein
VATKLAVWIRTRNFYRSELPWSLAVGSSKPSCGHPLLLKLCEDSKKPWWLLLGMSAELPNHTKRIRTQKKKKQENKGIFTLPIKH